MGATSISALLLDVWARKIASASVDRTFSNVEKTLAAYDKVYLDLAGAAGSSKTYDTDIERYASVTLARDGRRRVKELADKLESVKKTRL